MGKLKSTDGTDEVVMMFAGQAVMDVFSDNDEFIRTVPVGQVTKFTNEKSTVLVVQTHVNAYNYTVDAGASVVRNSDDGSISFISRGRKYKIRSAEDSENFNVPTYA